MLKRTPLWLRVVIDGNGKVDALNEVKDEPREGETVYVYALSAYLGATHIRAKKGGGFYPNVEYKLAYEGETGPALYARKGWEAWCESQPWRKEWDKIPLRPLDTTGT
jgi:hypothetical protein